MWTLTGFPLSTVTVPVWLTEGKNLPYVVSMKADLHSPLCDAALLLKDKCFPVKRGSGLKYLNLSVLLNRKNTGIMQLLEPVENEIFLRANEMITSASGKKPRDREILSFYKWLDEYIPASYKSLFGIEIK